MFLLNFFSQNSARVFGVVVPDCAIASQLYVGTRIATVLFLHYACPINHPNTEISYIKKSTVDSSALGSGRAVAASFYHRGSGRGDGSTVFRFDRQDNRPM
jgi:hypothetical protein